MLPRRVAVDLVYLTGRKGGTETYARGLYPALSRLAPELAFLGLTNAETGSTAPDWFPGAVVRLPVRGENRLAWAAAEAALVGPVARGRGADLLHCPANFGPAVRFLPTVVTVHDLLSLRHPDLVAGRLSRGVTTLVTASARAATRVLTDSRSSAADIRTFLRLPEDRVDVVPLATSAPAGADVPRSRLDGLGIPPGRPFALSTGNRMPHKNFPALLTAWSRIPADRRPVLVVTGSHGCDPLRGVVDGLGLSGDVRLLGWVDGEDLEALYAHATLYVCPSLFEGFGLPVLEAMQRGCPVVANDIPVLREVGADAVRYVDARSADALAAAVAGLAADPAERRRLRAAGRARAERFTWEETARGTLASFEQAVAGHPARAGR